MTHSPTNAWTTMNVLLVTTGGDEALLDAAEAAWAEHLEPRVELQLLRLGSVPSLAVAYANVARMVNDPGTALLLAHQDARPLLMSPREGEALAAALPRAARRWAEPFLVRPGAWVDIALERLSDERTGVLGVAGALGLEQGIAWWSYPHLSGIVVHGDQSGQKVNPLGPWGRVAVVDGVCMMVRADTMARLGPPALPVEAFHFYDMDLCLRAHESGLTNWTLPLVLRHGSGGASRRDERWLADQEHFLAAHRAHLPVAVEPQPLEVPGA